MSPAPGTAQAAAGSLGAGLTTGRVGARRAAAALATALAHSPGLAARARGIQHLVNPPGNPRAWYRTGPLPGADPGAWLADTTVHQGSWWAHWSRWVQARSGAQRRAPATPGGGRFGQLDQAPGRYVRQK